MSAAEDMEVKPVRAKKRPGPLRISHTFMTTPKLVLEAVAAHFEISVEDILSKSKVFADQRHVAMYIMHRAGMTNMAIKRCLQKDNTVIGGAIRRVKNEIAKDPEVAAVVASIEAKANIKVFQK